MNIWKPLAILSMAVLCSIATGASLYAQHESPDLKPSVEIEEIQVIGEAKRGDTFEIKVRYKTLVDAPGNITFRVPLKKKKNLLMKKSNF